MTYQEFVASPAARQRYWARAVRGWPRIRDARPNAAHAALARMEASGCITGIVTQNVDRVHQAAGSHVVIELHGALAEAVCLTCRAVETRASLHARLMRLNGLCDGAPAGGPLPDGDAAIADADIGRFEVAGCLGCGGVLKPNVVFFGENVPRPVHDASTAALDAAEALLIVGSSLAVYSGYRFLRRATERAIPTALVNLGPPQRGLDQLHVHVDGRAGDVLGRLSRALPQGPKPAGNDHPVFNSAL